jgi:hypothetical protein
MDLLFQDIAVTGVAFAAAVVLVRRVQSAVSPRRKSAPGCEACPKCERRET